jgi:predicted nucleic acid-binding protein
MTKLTIDSSVFLSALLPSDRLHDESRLFFERLKERPVTIVEPITVVFEVCNILVKNGVRDVSRVLERLMQFQILELDASSVPDAQFVFQKCQLKTADAIVVWCASVSESILVSWDHKLTRQAKNLVRAYTPREYIKDHFKII